MTAIEVQVFMPGVPESLTLDDYVDVTAMIAGCGMASELNLLPDFFYYDNPKTGAKCSIVPAPGE